MLLCSLAANAEAVRIDGIWYNLVSKIKQAEVISSPNGTAYSGIVVIPKTIIHDNVEYSVTSIGDQAFWACDRLTSITIPEGVTSIGESAFPSCSKLTSISIPESVTSIGNSAFENCSSLTSIIFSENSQLTSIGNEVFSNCSSLSSITIPKSVTSIGNSAFSICSSLTSITIPERVTSIGNSAFFRCLNLTTIIIPESVTSIGSSAFNDCRQLTSIAIPEGVTIIRDNTFQYCSSLTSITIPKGVTEIGHSAFAYCNKLSSISISESVTDIGYYAFSCCSKLTSITIPESVTWMGGSAFSGCSELATIVLPNSIKKIYSETFANCPNLLHVYCYVESVPSTETNAFNGSYPEYATLHVLASVMPNYKTTAPWSSFGTIVSLDATITSITLSESSVTLTEEESLTLAIITEPENADKNLITWSSSNPNVATVDNTGKVIAIAPGIATIIANANDGSGVSASCEVTVKGKLLGKCEIPMVNYTEGKVVLTCSTEDVEYITSVVPYNELNYQSHEFDFIPTYTFNVYATKAKYENSDVACVTICWIDCTEEHGDTDGILTIPSHPVLIQTDGGTITLTGLADGTTVMIYDLSGTQQGTATAANGTATITTSLTAGNTAIVKIGERSVKVVVK